MHAVNGLRDTRRSLLFAAPSPMVAEAAASRNRTTSRASKKTYSGPRCGFSLLMTPFTQETTPLWTGSSKIYAGEPFPGPLQRPARRQPPPDRCVCGEAVAGQRHPRRRRGGRGGPGKPAASMERGGRVAARGGPGHLGGDLSAHALERDPARLGQGGRSAQLAHDAGELLIDRLLMSSSSRTLAMPSAMSRASFTTGSTYADSSGDSSRFSFSAASMVLRALVRSGRIASAQTHTEIVHLRSSANQAAQSAAQTRGGGFARRDGRAGLAFFRDGRYEDSIDS